MRTHWKVAALALAASALAACQPVQMTAPSQAAQPVAVRFAIQAGDAPVTCTQGAEGLGVAGSPAQFNDLRFYVSNVALITAAGEAVPVALEQDGLWQSGSTALLDFEDGTAGCADSGTPDMNDVVSGAVAPGAYTGIQFDLGVPFASNHQDVTLAPSPLNSSPMWWNWQGGYKFVRIDMTTDAPDGGAWFIHLGSTGCMAADQATAPAAPCARPNLAGVRLDGFDPATNVIVADMATLLAAVDLSQSTPMPPGCMSGADDPDCAFLLPAFGLEIATGQCSEAGCPAQTFFRVQ